MKLNRAKTAFLLTALLLLTAVLVYAAPAKVLTITFDFERITGYSSNQYAVWLEDSQGNYVTTLSATRFSANKGFLKRPDAVPAWASISKWADRSQEEVDSISTPTPATGSVSAVWDGKDSQGRVMPPGTYTYKIEGTLYKGSRVLWTGSITTGQEDAVSSATPRYAPSEEEATAKGKLITNVKAVYK